MTITPTAEATGAAKPALSKGQLVALKPPRLPYHEAVEERFGIDRAGWKALVEAIYPNAETADAIVMALSYCRASRPRRTDQRSFHDPKPVPLRIARQHRGNERMQPDARRRAPARESSLKSERAFRYLSTMS